MKISTIISTRTDTVWGLVAMKFVPGEARDLPGIPGARETRGVSRASSSMRLLPPGLVLNLLVLLAMVAYLADPGDERPASQGGSVLGTHPGKVVTVAFSPDGRWLASGGWDSPVVTWNMAGRRAETDLEGSPASTFSLAFSPDGATLAAAGVDGAVRVWETGTWSLLRVIQAHSGAARSLSFSPDGKLLTTVGADGVIALWSTDTWRARKRVQAQEGLLRCVAFSPGGSG